MKLTKLAALATALSLSVAGCAVPMGPVEVTRFHVPDVTVLGKGAIAVEPAAGMDGNSLEWRSYQLAVQRKLILLGYTDGSAAQSPQVAELRLARRTIEPEAGAEMPRLRLSQAVCSVELPLPPHQRMDRCSIR